ncbi:DegT/DnrJ/EryC1/StrS family aminotransferase [Gammaproteobacteria bacterium]|nr:DegT/DnrJ/EryC1/StrS family aminotransferase [Gammaproteobacteria bacterium]
MKKFEFILQYPTPLEDEDLVDLLDIAKSGNFSRYASDYVLDLEKDLAKYYETNHSVTCSSGTAALHGCLVALDLPPGSEVVITPVADIGVVLPIIYENLIPVFGDLDPSTYNISLESIKSTVTEKTKAVIAVHLGGNPADIVNIKEFCKERNIFLLEDFSQAHGAILDGKKIGSFGDISYGSYQQSKQITCGEGGVIVTNSKKLRDRAFIGVDKGWQRHLPLKDRFYEFLAPNVRFNAIQAAILKPQLPKLDSLLNEKRKRAKILDKIFSKTDCINTQKISEGALSSYYSYPLFLHKKDKRDALLDKLKIEYSLVCAHGYANPTTLYECVNALIDPQKYGKGFLYQDRRYPKGTSPHAEDLLERSFLIPFNENYSIEDTEEIGHRVLSALEELGIS